MGETPVDLTLAVRRTLEADFSEEALKQWFDPLRLRKNHREKELTIIWPHRFFADWMPVEHVRALEGAVRQIDKNFQLVYADGSTVSGLHTQDQGQNSRFPAQREPTSAQSAIFLQGESFSLDNYFSNTKNAFPLTVLREVITGELRWNPLVLYGTTSTGKSHLVKAMGNALSAKYGHSAVFCGSTDDLVTLKASLTDQELLVALTQWQAVLVDDMQRIPTLNRLWDVMPLIMDHCCETNKPFLCTICLPPSQWNLLPQRISARLEQGLVMLLHEADMDIRLRFAQQHSRLKRLSLSREQLLTLAQQCTSLRRLTGIIQRLSALRDLLNHDISTQDIEGVLAHTADNATVTPQVVIRVVAAKCGVRAEDITGAKRQPKVTRARQIAMFLCRSLLGASYPALGRLFGGRDHSTVIHSVKKIQLLRETNTDMHTMINELSLSCRQQQK